MKLVVLALDQAATSGYSLWVVDSQRDLGVMVSHGTARNCTERKLVLDAAHEFARVNDSTLHVVFEDHSKIPASKARGTTQILGMGDARGRWQEQLDLRGHSKACRHMVTPHVWRGAVLGAFYASAKTDVAKAAAVRHAGSVAGTDVKSHDAAEAVCLGQYSARNLPAILDDRRKKLGVAHA